MDNKGMLGKNDFEPEPYKEQPFINDICTQVETRKSNQNHDEYPDGGYVLACESDESLKSIERNPTSPYAPTTSPRIHTPLIDKGRNESYTETSICLKDFLSHLNCSRAQRFSYFRKPNFNDFRMKLKSFKEDDFQSCVKPKQTLSSKDRKSSASNEEVVKPSRLQPINRNLRRSKGKNHYPAQAFNVSGNAMMFDSKSKYFPNKDYNPGFVKRKSHDCNRCANRMSAHDHHSWLESFHLACRARRCGGLKSIVAGEPLLSICGSQGQVLNPIVSVSTKVKEQKSDEDTSLEDPNSTSQVTSFPSLKRDNCPVKGDRRARCGTLQDQLEGLMITMPLDREHIQSYDDCPRSWSQKLIEDDSSTLIDEHALHGKSDTLNNLQESSGHTCKTIEGDLKCGILEEHDSRIQHTLQESLGLSFETINTKQNRTLGDSDLDQSSNIKQCGADDLEIEDEKNNPLFESGPRSYRNEESSAALAPETLRLYSYSVMDDRNNIVYRPDSILSSSGAVSYHSKLPITVSLSDEDLRENVSCSNMELNHNSSAIETKYSEADSPRTCCMWSSDQSLLEPDREQRFLRAERKEGQWRTKYENSKPSETASKENYEVCRDDRFLSDDPDSNVDVISDVYSDHEKESEEEECEDMMEDDDEEDSFFYPMRTYPPNSIRENFKIPTGKMLCYTAITDKRYNKWSRRKKKTKKKTKKKARLVEERPAASSGNENSRNPEKIFLRYLIKNNQDTISMRYRHDSKCVARELSRLETFDQACSGGALKNKRKSTKGYREKQTQNLEIDGDCNGWNEFDRNGSVSRKMRVDNTDIVPVFSFAFTDQSPRDNYLSNETKRESSQRRMAYRGSDISMNSNGKESAKIFQNVNCGPTKGARKPFAREQYLYHKGEINFGGEEDAMQVGDKMSNNKNGFSSFFRLSLQANCKVGKPPSNVKCTFTPIDCYSSNGDVTNKNNSLVFTNLSERKSQSATSDESIMISSESNCDERSNNSLLDKTMISSSSDSAGSFSSKLQVTGKNRQGISDESWIPMVPASERGTSDEAVTPRMYSRKFLSRDLGQRNGSIMCPLPGAFPRVDIQIRTTLCPKPTTNTKHSSKAGKDADKVVPQKQQVNKPNDMKFTSKKSKRRSKLDKDMEIVTIQDLLSDLKFDDQIVLNQEKPTSKKNTFQGATFREIYGKSPHNNGRKIITSRKGSPYKAERSVSASSLTKSYRFSALPLPVLLDLDKGKSKKHTS